MGLSGYGLVLTGSCPKSCKERTRSPNEHISVTKPPKYSRERRPALKCDSKEIIAIMSTSCRTGLQTSTQDGVQPHPVRAGRFVHDLATSSTTSSTPYTTKQTDNQAAFRSNHEGRDERLHIPDRGWPKDSEKTSLTDPSSTSTAECS